MEVEFLDKLVTTWTALEFLRELWCPAYCSHMPCNTCLFKWVCHHQKGGNRWNSVGNSSSTTLRQWVPLHVLIMTNTIRELMCLATVSQRNCRRGYSLIGTAGAAGTTQISISALWVPMPMGTQRDKIQTVSAFHGSCFQTRQWDSLSFRLCPSSNGPMKLKSWQFQIRSHAKARTHPWRASQWQLGQMPLKIRFWPHSLRGYKCR